MSRDFRLNRTIFKNKFELIIKYKKKMSRSVPSKQENGMFLGDQIHDCYCLFIKTRNITEITQNSWQIVWNQIKNSQVYRERNVRLTLKISKNKNLCFEKLKHYGLNRIVRRDGRFLQFYVWEIQKLFTRILKINLGNFVLLTTRKFCDFFIVMYLRYSLVVDALVRVNREITQSNSKWELC